VAWLSSIVWVLSFCGPRSLPTFPSIDVLCFSRKALAISVMRSAFIGSPPQMRVIPEPLVPISPRVLAQGRVQPRFIAKVTKENAGNFNSLFGVILNLSFGRSPIIR
jgi:hypothetical protein